jgi:hypothetical protein
MAAPVPEIMDVDDDELNKNNSIHMGKKCLIVDHRLNSVMANLGRR